MSDWMLFVDGENFTLRGQELARQRELKLDAIPQYYLQDVWLWIPDLPTLQRSAYRNRPEKDRALRGYYYTSVVGDEQKIWTVKQSLRALDFDPQVFKKTSQARSKGIDITLTKDMLSHAFLDHYQDAVLVAGDGDYIRLVDQVKRLGKRVYVAFFTGDKLGLSEDLRMAADSFVDLTPVLSEQWELRLQRLRA